MTEPEAKRDTINTENTEPQEPAINEAQVEQQDHDPTWFAQSAQSSPSHELVLRYRAKLAEQEQQRLNQKLDPNLGQNLGLTEAEERYRRRMEERFWMAKQMAEQQLDELTEPHPGHEPAPQRRPAARKSVVEMIGEAPEEDGLLLAEIEPYIVQRGPRRRKPRTGKVAGVIAAACVVGAGLGYAAAHPIVVADFFTSTQATVAAFLLKPDVQVTAVDDKSSVPQTTTVLAKPVQSARVEVVDVSGALNESIPLELTAIPASPDQPISLRITGVPDDAYLTQGTEIGKGQWIVRPQEIDSVEIVVPKAVEKPIDLSVAAIEERTGTPAAPAQNMTVALETNNLVVVPANAAPEGSPQLPLPQAVPVPLEVENSEALNLMSKGDALLRTGDLVSARQFYLRAHDKGLKQAAYGVGRTYDPVLYAEMKVRGIQPDLARAQLWYGKARDAGSTEAAAALAKLPQ